MTTTQAALLEALLTDDKLRAIWRQAGGRFHGPNIETGTMPESKLLPFLRGLHIAALRAADAAQPEPVGSPWIDRVVKVVEFIAYLARIDNDEAIPQAMLDLRKLLAAPPQPAPIAAQAGPALVPLTDEQIERGREVTFSTGNPFSPCDSKTMRKAVRWAERAHGIGAPASTRPADASIQGRRIAMTPMTREQILRAAVAAMPATNPLVADDLIEGHTMHTEADDIVAIWNAALAAAPQAPAEHRTVSLAELNDTTGHSNGGEMWGGYGSFWLTTTTDVMPAEPAAQAAQDAARFRWLVEDHADAETRARISHILNRLSVMSYGAACAAIDAAMAATPAAREALPVHEVWREGYRITGESEGAVKLGEAQAATFEEACDIVCRGKADYDAKTRRVWGCRLFNNEADARKAFG